MRTLFLTLLGLALSLPLAAQPDRQPEVVTGFGPAPLAVKRDVHSLFRGVRGDWAAQQVAAMSLEEKIGQLFMVPVWTSRPQYNRTQVERLIRQYNIGGVIFMQGGPSRQVFHANAFQRLSKLPLLVGQDAEWGVAMRLDSSLGLPKQLVLGAVQADSIHYAYGREIARQARALGVHIAFSPVVDVNNNPRNPVIGDRSFGEDKHAVTRRALMVMQGLQENGVMACAKHFPGHGDTDVDSHYDLPVIAHNNVRLDTLELYPFQQLIREGVQSVMVAHLYIPAIDTTTGRPTTLSPRVVNSILRQNLDFAGLVFTDALNMKGLAKYYPPGRAEVAALLAGNDVLLFPENVPLAVDMIKRAIFDSLITEREIDQRVYKILLAKEWLGLNKNRFVPTQPILQPGADSTALALRRTIARASMTLAQNPANILPLADLSQRIAYLQIGDANRSLHYQQLAQYAGVDFFTTGKDLTDAETNRLLQRLDGYTTVLVGLLDMTRSAARQYGVPPPVQDLLCKLSKTGKAVHITAFGSPYAAEYIPKTVGLLFAYNDTPEAQLAAADVVMGSLTPTGVSPVTAIGRTRQRPAYYDSTARRLRPLTAERAASPRFARVDTLVTQALAQKAMTGAAVVVVQGNEVVYSRGFGFADSTHRVSADPLTTGYDVASVTKVAATTLAAMRAVDLGKLDLDATLDTYLPEVKESPKAAITIRQLLQHDAGLPAFIPFWKQYVQRDSATATVRLDTAWFRGRASDTFSIRLTDSLWLHRDMPQRIWQQVLEAPLTATPGERVVYSDLGMIILGRVLDKQLGEPVTQYVTREFYQPLGMTRTTFSPRSNARPLDSVRWAPSEVDTDFRLGLVQGFVNDEAAALLGGAAGHAGLFSTAYDLAKLLTMLKNGGVYAGKRYLQFETIATFTAAQPGRRRGLGWDKPTTDGTAGPTAVAASPDTYGHLGFTGTCVWVDPANDLVYVLLSNRTYPDSANPRFGDLLVRKSVMEAVYEAIAPRISQQ